MPDPDAPNLTTAIEHAAEAFSALLGCLSNKEPIPPSLWEAADTAIGRLKTIARNLRAATLNAMGMSATITRSGRSYGDGGGLR